MCGIVRLGQHGDRLRGRAEDRQDRSKELVGPKNLLAGPVPGKSGCDRVRFEDIGDYCSER